MTTSARPERRRPERVRRGGRLADIDIGAPGPPRAPPDLRPDEFVRGGRLPDLVFSVPAVQDDVTEERRRRPQAISDLIAGALDTPLGTNLDAPTTAEAHPGRPIATAALVDPPERPRSFMDRAAAGEKITEIIPEDSPFGVIGKFLRGMVFGEGPSVLERVAGGESAREAIGDVQGARVRRLGQAGLGLAESAMATTQGLTTVARLPERFPILQFVPPLFLANLIAQELDPILAEGREAAREIEPENAGDLVTRIAGRIAGDLVQIATTGPALGLTRAAAATGGKAAIARAAAISTPVAMIQSAGSAEESVLGAVGAGVELLGGESSFTRAVEDIVDNPVLRTGIETAIDFALGGVAEVAVPFVQRVFKARALSEAASAGGRVAPGEPMSRGEELRRTFNDRGGIPMGRIPEATGRPRRLQTLAEIEDRLRAGSAREVPSRPSQRATPPVSEQVGEAAVRDPVTGRVFYGQTHNDARQAARSELPLIREIDGRKVKTDPTTFEDGFATNKREFVTRDEAQDLAIDAGQIDTFNARGLVAEQLGRGSALGQRSVANLPGVDAARQTARRAAFVPQEAASERFNPFISGFEANNIEELNLLMNEALDVGGQGDVVARILNLAPPQRIDGLGVSLEGKVNPNTVMRLVADATDTQARKLAALHGIIQGQNQAVWLREVAGTVEGARQGFVFPSMTRFQFRRLARVIADDPDLSPLRGSTLVENQAIFQNFSDVSDGDYLKLLTEAVGRIEGDLVAEGRFFIGELLDGPAAYRQALEGDEVRQALGLLDERSRPIFRQVAAGAGQNARDFDGRVDDFVQAVRGASRLEQAAATVAREAAPGVAAAGAAGVAAVIANKTGASPTTTATAALIGALAGFKPARRALVQRIKNLGRTGFAGLGGGRGALRDQVRLEVAGIGRVAKYLDSAEARKLNRATARRTVELFDELPSAGELTSLALAGRAKRGWFTRAADAISEVWGPDAPRFTALLAALSPQVSVRANLGNALRTWNNWIKLDPVARLDPAEIKRVLAMSVEGTRGEDSVLGAWVPNAIRALTADDPISVVLSGPKVNSFLRNLLGDVGEVTLDTWMAKIAGWEQAMFGGRLNRARTDPGKVPAYLAFTARVRQAAERMTRLTGQEWTPAEIQESVWSWAYALGKIGRAQGGDLVRAIDDVTDEAIRDVPDFRSLLNDAEFKETLLRGNLTPPRDVGEPGAAARAAARETEGATGLTPRPADLRRAARRIERAGVPDERGVATAEVVSSIAGAGVGAAVGAAGGAALADQPAAGAVVGGVAGLLAGAGVPRAARRITGAVEGRIQGGRLRQAQAEATQAESTEFVEGLTREAGVGAPPGAQTEQRLLGETAEPFGDIQFNKFGLDAKGQAKLEESVAGMGNIRRKVTFDEVESAARALGMEDFRQADLNNQIDGVVLLGIRQTYNDNLYELSVLNAQLEELINPRTVDPAIAALSPRAVALREFQLSQLVDRLDRENEALLRMFIPGASDAGRTLNSLKILARHNLDDPFPWIVKASKLAGRDLLPEEIQAIRNAIATGDRETVLTVMKQFNKPTALFSFEGANLVRRANLLTGLRTQSRNFLSNTAEAVMGEFDNAGAVLGDKVVSFMLARATSGRLVGSRTRAWRTLDDRVKASRLGVRKGMENFGKVMRGVEIDAGTLRRLDLRREASLDNRFFDAYVKFMFRFQGAVDQPFRQVAFMSSIIEQARLLGRSQGLRKEELESFIDLMLVKPSDDLVMQAIVDSEEAVFQNKTALGGMISRGKRFLQLRGQGKGPKAQAARAGLGILDFVIPFSQTPSAVLTRLVERTPIGLVSSAAGLFELARLAGAGESVEVLQQIQREIATRFGRAATGTGVMALGLGYVLAAKGKISGRWPDDTRESRSWIQEGKSEDSIKLPMPGGARWFKLNGISPVGNLVAIGGQLAMDATNPDYQPSDLISFAGTLATNTAIGAIRTVKEQSFLRGVNDLLDAVDNERGMGERYFLSSVTSFLPIALGDVARFLDPVIRRPENLGDALQTKLPAMTFWVPASIDEFGRPRVSTTGPVERVTRLFDPFLSVRDRTLNDPVLRELKRVGAVVSRPAHLEDETEPEYRERRASEGQQEMAAILVTTELEAYRRMGVIDQRRVMQDVMTAVRRTMRDRGIVPQSWRPEIMRVISNARRRAQTRVIQERRQERRQNR